MPRGVAAFFAGCLAITTGTFPQEACSAIQAANDEAPQPSRAPSAYVIDGLALGEDVRIGSDAYKTLQCAQSDFPELTRCYKQRVERGRRGKVTRTIRVLHTSGGTAVYVSRNVEPEFFESNDPGRQIAQFSAAFGEKAHEFKLPHRGGFPDGIIAVWGQLTLEQIDAKDASILNSGGSLHRGILISFLSDVRLSAKLGLPIYRLAGGPGFLWAANFGHDGRGASRLLAVDPTQINTPGTPSSRAEPQDISLLHRQTPQASAEVVPDSFDPRTLERSQSNRDTLFKELRVSAAQYAFDYFVINLPPGSLSGINVSVPVAHVRYSDTVFFDFDKSDIKPFAQEAVAAFARTLMKDKSYRSILVVGHTDSIGTDEYNYGLARSRAATVATSLRSAGITDQFLGVVPMGKAQPLTTNSTTEGRALNRRVEFFISDVPAATKVAIEQIKFNPCFINDNDGKDTSNCNDALTRIPVLSSTGEGRPIDTLDLSRSAIPESATTFRLPLPNETLERPSLKELQQP